MNTPVLPTDSLPALSKLAHYRLVRKIGQGGMSVVYEAFDERLKRSIAIKLLHPFLASSPEYKTRFLREAEAVARLAHPNIVQIYDICEDEQLYIVTELLSGGTLKEKASLINFHELPELSAMVISQVAQALEHAHQKGIIHRDIKPENIMITNEGHIKLMDFGIASMGHEESLTQAGVLLGSLAHAAPEVIKGERASVRSDIFSLSTVFFWLTSGQLPFKGDSPHALLKAIVDSPAQKIQGLSPYISDRLAHIIEQGMHKDPQQRFSSASLVVEAIKEALLEMGLVFDLNKLTVVLSNPDVELSQLKSAMLESIRNQALEYQRAGSHALALALQCRLDAISPHPIKKRRSPKKLRWAVFLCGTGLIALGLSYLIPKNSLKKPEPLIAPIISEPEISAKLENVIPEKELSESAPPAPQVAPIIQEPKAPTKQELDITIWPFANIMVDNLEVAKDVKHMNLRLEPGTHRLKFTHTYAASVEKVVHIKAGEAQNLNIIMNKTKPAFLVINSPIDADVAINGLFKGSSIKSISRPIVVPMPDKTHALDAEIIVQRDGFEPLVLSLTFIAGQTQKIHVTLVPTPHSPDGEP